MKTPPVFSYYCKGGNIPGRDMFNTFNMGVGMCCRNGGQKRRDRAVGILRDGEDAYVMGESSRDEGVILC